MADDNVVDFGDWKEKSEIVWTCGCGNQLFYMLDTLRARCYGCNSIFTFDEDEDE